MTAALKAALRTQALQARAQAGARGDAQQVLTRHLKQVLAPFAGQVLAGFWPMRDEPDPRPAMRAHQGPVCLPVVPGRAVPLIFRRWDGGPLEPGPFGTSHPPASAGLLVPQVLIVPLAAFDRTGNRIGYGGGYYDRAIARLHERGLFPRLIGVAFDCQQVPAVPAEAHDVPLPYILTETGLHALGTSEKADA